MTYAEAEREIDSVEQELIDAICNQDAATLERIISDDFVITGEPLGEKLADKQLYVADCLASGAAEVVSASYDRIKLRVYENTAIINSILKYQVKIEGKEYDGAFLATRVWIKNDEQWRLVTTHSHRLTDKST
jgi:ketosteroid isomerase-like protein